ncbi:T9SS type A sorting domain-containing protein [Aquimarina brevivitae]|uniref:Putative secreted protein (Por secretion system target) n=1 Tax=Aquimarina brevivitae TaxID=323412 RepID=A0A4V2F7J3_9FLAO|nr:T9SS type A sorting domain-containing protein [Aquimarina brevivitae]RZT00020.1 putative secreted protein (Por secretion system target) [Aquimarina brevivitae]
MKKLLLLLCMFSTAVALAQYNPNAPWMKTLENKNNKPLKFEEIVDAFNTYWKDKDHTKKGSGYKPFKRWEAYWKHFVKEDGTLPTPQELYATLEQKRALEAKLVDQSNWQSLGPYAHTNTGSWSSGQGRVNVITVDPNNQNVIYVGAPAGGIWKSTDAGTTWTPLSDELLQIGVSAIAIDNRDSNVIYIGTGDDDGADSYSIGVLKSTDGGLTWNSTNLTFRDNSSFINEVYLDPTNQDKVFVSSNRGFYKSTDGGANFTVTLNQDLDDIKLKPGDSNVIYAATNTDVFVSIDNGDSFQLADTGLPSISSRLVLAVSADAPNNVYVLSAASDRSFQGIFKSINSGGSYSRLDDGSLDLFDGSTQAWYDLALEVSDVNSDQIYLGTVDVFRSIDGGVNFEKWNSWSNPSGSTYTHADIHMIREFNGNLFFGTDGGIYELPAGLASTVDLTEGLAIGQFYRISVSNQTSNNIMGGLQDNGGYAYSDNNWKNYYGADGMDTAIDPNDPNKYYGFVQNGGGLYFSNDAGVSLAGSINGPEQGNWITPLIMNKEGELYAGYTRLYKLESGQFQVVSQNLLDNIDGIAVDPIDSDNMYVFINRVLRKSVDRGATFTVAHTFNGNITSLAVSSTNNEVVYVTTTTNVYKSVNGGVDFEDITFNLPFDTKLVVKHQGLHPDNPIFVGTSLGVYRLDETQNTWETFANNLPNTAVRDIEINELDGNITIATYGRGVWRSDIPEVQAGVDMAMLSGGIGQSQTFVCGNVTPRVTLQNNGTATITDFIVRYDLNNASVVEQSWSGSLAPNENVDVVFPTITLDEIGQQTLSFSVEAVNDAFVVNNSRTANFFVNKSADLDVFDFESQDQEFVVQGGLWERGIPTGTLLNAASSGQNVYATNLSGNYSDQTRSYLVSRCYDLSAIENPVLKFDMAFDIELDWDFVNVEYTLDGGTTWQILGQFGDPSWYNSETLPGNNCRNCPGAQWTGADTTLKEYSYDLVSLTNETSFIFRFNFVSDQSVNNEGVVIDDVRIEGNSLSIDDFENQIAFVVYPNPSKDIFNIQWRNASTVKYSVYDITGKLVLKKDDLDLSDQETQIDLSSFTKGVYFLKIALDSKESNVKLLKR